MTAIGAVDLSNTYTLRKEALTPGKVPSTGKESTEMVTTGKVSSTGKEAWEKASYASGIIPTIIGPVKPAKHVYGVEKPEVLSGNSEEAIKSIGKRGALAFDTTMGVNQPIVYLYDNGANVGANHRYLA